MHYRFVAHQMSPWRVRYFRVMVPLSAGRAARVLTMSRDLARTLVEVAPAARGKTRVVYEGADLAAFGPEGERAAGGPYLLYVSSLNPFKRPDSLVRALARLRGDGFEPPPARLCGRPDPPDRARVEALARELGVADLVRVEGVVEHRRLAPLYRGAAALVYPSAVETFGLPPLEAMACGCPVVASNRTAVPEIVGNGALVVDPDDVGALADAIRRLLTDSALRRDLVARGFANLRRFDWAVTAEETLAALRAAAR
jgi:glycosyltransferase involved in cell wall biosynthesis